MSIKPNTKIIFLPSDPDEFVDQIKLIVFEKVGRIDNPMLNEQIIAIVDKLLEYECITTNQYQNIVSAFDCKKSLIEDQKLYILY